MSEGLNLVEKLAKIRAISDVVVKDKTGFNYTYADITQILAKVTAGMKKYGVSLIPQVVPGTLGVTRMDFEKQRRDKQGNTWVDNSTEMLVTGEMVFRWVNDSNPTEFIEVPWVLTGMQSDPSQAFGSAITYCTRYFLTSYFNIAQSDLDPDAYRSKQKSAAAMLLLIEGKGFLESY